LPHFVGVGHILRGSDLIATVPERLAQHLAEPFGLTYRPHPFALPEIAINVFWHAKVHQSPANQWLRRMVFELFADDTSGRAEVRG
jgi:DNA-binding transcriptional LysR family regulator